MRRPSTLAGPAMLPLGRAAARLADAELGAFAVIGGVAVTARLGRAHRATADVDTVVDDDTPPSALDVLRHLDGATPVETRAHRVYLDGTKVEVIGTGAGYVITTPLSTTEPLPKRRAIHALVMSLHEAGVSANRLNAVLPKAKFHGVEGTLDGDELTVAFIAAYPAAERNLGRWFLETPLHDNGQTWLLSKMWGLDTEGILDALVGLAPDQGFAFESA